MFPATAPPPILRTDDRNVQYGIEILSYLIQSVWKVLPLLAAIPKYNITRHSKGCLKYNLSENLF